MFKRILEFNRTEKNGILVLIILIFIVIGINLFLPQINSTSAEKLNHEEEYQYFLSLIEEQDNTSDSTGYNSESYIFAEEKSTIKYFEFNPNTATVDDLKKLGFNRFQINNLQKYLKAGGQIHKKKDLQKIYGIDQSFYETVEPYMVIPEQLTEEKISKIKSEPQIKNAIVPFPINSATKQELQQVYGVGPKRSETILKYRDLLGGYYRIEQLYEVFGLPDSTIQELADVLIFDPSSVNHISVNQSEFGDLVRHPYISEFETKSILKYRDMKGKIKSTEELYANKVIDSITWEKVQLYLKP